MAMPISTMSCATTEVRAAACEPMPSHIKVVGQAKSIASVEMESLGRVRINPNVPQVPFGAAHAEWEALLEKMKPTDLLYEVSSSGGWSGYAAMRGTCVIGYQIVTVI